MTELTRTVLEAATDLLASRGVQGLRMADVATRAGVSRQSVYNEFGNKERIVHAVALYKTEEFLDGVRSRLATAADPVDGVRDATAFVFERAARDPLTQSLFSGANAEDMLPLVTTRGHPVMAAATDVFLEHFHLHYPWLSAERAELIAEHVVRLMISHLLTPSRDPVQAVVCITHALLHAP
ncbi:TetR family transcriptional regulator [Actinosynnema sp. NPDC023587]|uniref:TetR/AcrR family transcriptional regulator n=1 Tax=Actinosynnema sp. NPDC023587 TaxID=3154695 RepID=UPI0033FEA1BA